MTTLSDVAVEAGVSTATVSRVLNGTAGVSAVVARTVRATVEQMGYQSRLRRPRRETAGRKGLRTGNVLLLSAGFDSADHQGVRGHPSLMRGVERAVREAGLKLMIATLEQGGDIPVALDDREVDGVLLFVYGNPETLPDAVLTQLDRIPTVSLMRDYEILRNRFDQVLFNNEGIGPMAADYLIGRRHRALAFLNALGNHPMFNVRLNGFATRAHSSGIEVLPLIETHPLWNYPESVAACEMLVERLLAAKPIVTGIFVAHDYQVPLLYQALERRGAAPGHDLDIIGCDNEVFFLDRLSPKPATIDTNVELVGKRGLDQLLWRMAHRDVKNCMRVSIEPVLVPGVER